MVTRLKRSLRRGFTVVEMLCSVGITGAVVSVGVYKIQSSRLLETTQAVVNNANAAVLNSALQQAVVTGRYTPTSTDADVVIGEMMNLGLISRFEYRGGYYLDRGFFYAVPGFKPKLNLPDIGPVEADKPGERKGEDRGGKG